MKKWIQIFAVLGLLVLLPGMTARAATAVKTGQSTAQKSQAVARNVSGTPQQEQDFKLYYDFLKRVSAVRTTKDITAKKLTIVEAHSFPVVVESFGEEELTFIPAIDKKLGRLVLFLADEDGEIVYMTHQLEANNVARGQVKQPVSSVAAVSFQDVNGDELTDIVLIVQCVNEDGKYADKSYKVGDVLFQGEGYFYRDYRISDKLNRFSMNKSIDFIMAYARDGQSTEYLYTSNTLTELLDNEFEIIKEQCYPRNFEKLGKLQVVPGIAQIAEYDVFMIYLINDKDRIAWSFQPMTEYDNLYALKGLACVDLDGDGMKDLVVHARFSKEDEDGKLVVDPTCTVYYQRTGGFDEDLEFEEYYQCTEEDTVYTLIDKIREYWGWGANYD